MTFGQELSLLFRNMPVASIICLAIGIVLIIVEIFKPGFGVFGILGGLSTVAGIVIRVLVKDGNIFIQIFTILIIDILIAVIAFVTMYLLMRYGFLKRTPLVLRGTAVGIDHSEGTVDNRLLVGKEGVAKTNLHPVGTAEVDGKTIDVVSDGEYIDKGQKIKIIAVQGSKTTVTRI